MFNKIFPSLTEKAALRILSLSVAAYVLVFFAWCCLKYYGFAYDDFDLAIHDQIIWNILHGRIFNSILGVDFLGNHVHLISFFVAPFYALVPHPLFLLALQTVFLAAGAFPLYRLARLYLGTQMSLIVCIIYLLYPGLGFMNLYEFHPTCFVTFFLLCTAYFFYKQEFFLFNVFMVLSLFCQENIALIFIMWGIYACLLKREFKWVLWPIGVGLMYFLFCVYIVLPGFNKNTFNFFHIYGFLGDSLGKVVQTCFLHPVRVLAILFQPLKIYYLIDLFTSVMFIPLFSSLSLLPAFLVFMQHLLSIRLSEVSLHYHYTAELIPFIFVAFVFGIKRITSWGKGKHRFLGAVLLVNALMANIVLGPHFHFIKESRHIFFDNGIVHRESLIKQIPKDASVVATFKFLPRLSHRQDIYSFHYVYTGFYTLSRKPFHLPDNVQYALVDFNDPRTFQDFYKLFNYRHIDDFLPQGAWGSMDVQGGIVLFKKGARNKYPLFNFINDHMPVPHPVHCIVDHRIELYGYDCNVRSERIHVIFYWKLLRPEPKDINIFIDFMDQYGNIINRECRPLCYRIWPTQAWQTNQAIEEHQYFSISSMNKRRLKALKVGFYDYKTGIAIPTDSKDVLGRIDIELTDQPQADHRNNH